MKNDKLRHWYVIACAACLALLVVGCLVATASVSAQSTDPPTDIFLPLISQNDASTLAPVVRATAVGESKLFVALLVAADGAETTATGIATVRLSNNQQRAFVYLNFKGLSSPQTKAYIRNTRTNATVLELPTGQLNNQRWPIDQAILNKLRAEKLAITIQSEAYENGEIRAILVPVDGSIEMPPSPAPDSIEALTDNALQRDIARFLTQSTFGPTPKMVADLKARVEAKGGDRIAAYGEWLDEQMEMDSPSLQAFYKSYRQLYIDVEACTGASCGKEPGKQFTLIKNGLSEGWFTSAVYSKAQLRERVGLALSELFVISINDGTLKNSAIGVADYYDMLRQNAFGEYKTLLTDVSLHPAMGWYLSHIQNQAEQRDADGVVVVSPDENYAREVMQLFSIGLLQLHPDGSLKLGKDGQPIRTYGQPDITELSRVFTGWALSVRNPADGETDEVVENKKFNFSRHEFTARYHPYLSTPMKNFEGEPGNRYHDAGKKKVLGKIIKPRQSGQQDLDDAMMLLSNHANTAPFISYRLIQALVTSNPSSGYLYRVSSVFTETDGDLGEVIKAILLDPEARNPSFLAWRGYGKKKEPLVHFTAMLRLIQAESTVAESYPLTILPEAYGPSELDINRYEAGVNLLFLDTNEMQDPTVGFAQTPLRAPSVFNWFLPDYRPPGDISAAGLVAPELQLATENFVISYYNTFYNLLLTDGLKAGRPQDDADKTSTTYELPRWLLTPYMAVMDTNNDGEMTKDDDAFDQPEAIRNATAKLVDRLDIYLCSGRLRANSAKKLAAGGPTADPYTILVDGLVSTMGNLDFKSAAKAVTARNERIREALFLVGTAPDCLVQQ